MNNSHIPVMLKEVLDYLKIKKGKWYLDCNLGGSGHTDAILEEGGKILGIDLDSQSIKFVSNKHGLEVKEINGQLRAFSNNLILIQENFANLKKIIAGLQTWQSYGNLPNTPNLPNPPKKFSGILFDLGLSSNQLVDINRGFSFNIDSPLDMRMGENFQVKASDLLVVLSERELTELFSKLGEEPFSKRIARAIVDYRRSKKIETTKELADLILKVVPKRLNQIHPATRVFQALRIAVNDELNNLKEALPQALETLESGGKMVVISFHSLEDRIVKNFFKENSNPNLLNNPNLPNNQPSLKILTKKPLITTQEEINLNPHSRSAKLRAAEKI